MRTPPSIFLFALAFGLAGPLARAQSEVSPKDGAASGSTPGEPAERPPTPKVNPALVAAQRLSDLIKRGSDLCASGDVDEGLPALRAAWTQRKDSDLAVVMASCEIRASEWPSAAEHLAYALRSKDDPQQRKPLEATFTSVRARVGAVKVTVTVDGADIFAGDRFAGQSPLASEVYVVAGKSVIYAKKTSYGEIEGTVDVKPGGTTTLKLDLAAGGAIAQSQRVTSNRSTAPAYVLGAFGLAALGAGAALYAAALSKGSAADDLLTALGSDYPTQSTSPCYNPSHTACETLKNLRQSHDAFANAGTGLLVGGGILGVTAIIYGLWATFAPPPSERPANAKGRMPFTLDLAASPGSGGVWLRGAF